MPKWITGNAENLQGMPKWIDNVLLKFRSKLIGLVTLPLTHLVYNVLKQPSFFFNLVRTVEWVA